MGIGRPDWRIYAQLHYGIGSIHALTGFYFETKVIISDN